MSIHALTERDLPPAPSQGPADLLRIAAFGDRPGLHPLPPAADPEHSWLRAVALGGQGRYAAARAELARLRGRVGDRGVWASLGASTEASLLRQLGGHRAAAILDGRALAAVGAVRAGDVPSVRAWCDAVTGLAADALGRGRLPVSRTLLARCASVLDEAEAGGAATAGPGGGDAPYLRQRIRLAWVSAETALAAGDFATARPHAERAVALSETFGSVRHAIKSELVRAASLTGEKDLGPAREAAAEVLARTGEHGLVPLQWAAAMLLHGLGGGDEAAHVRDRARDTVVHRGGRFATNG
ncbi:hypothetical protein OED52_14960 [Rhodococcus sp. Z13]|uniref:Uncharacterized protein n=1 Tax=Rhodococcus sacchari TaxID=2962047 RepID=A0ACD4DD29_9NOCA|nr:hypothetical protein [Rhodococcus sp. Z13]UYP17960.1 hypothetical protein OED52_14960 [Rhodococcus sp. Z13]